MLSDKMLKALNDQMDFEFSSAYLYLAMAAHCEARNLPGFAQWFKAQFGEEQAHAMKLFGYVADRGGTVALGAIAKPTSAFGSPLDTFKEVLAHEQKVTAAINKLYEVALAEKDYATQTFLQWYINEQVEEEKTAEDIIRQLEAIGGKAHLMLMLDHRLGERK
ncbi:MAG TPA: ferritin [Phycisphaerae bacterium]|nr:ferritin [Phycisphaerae bacterium]